MVDFEADDAPSQYSEESARALRGAGEALITHLRSYLEVAVSAAGPADQPGLVDPADELIALAALFDGAHFDHLGVSAPIGDIDDLGEGDDDDFDEEEVEEEIIVGQGISVLTRQDFVVPDPDRIIAAGRAAYLKTWPDDRPQDAENQVSNLGLALYELIHNDGRDALDRLDELQPTASITVFQSQDEPLDEEQFEAAGQADVDPEPGAGFLNLFQTTGAVLFSFSEVHQSG